MNPPKLPLRGIRFLILQNDSIIILLSLLHHPLSF